MKRKGFNGQQLDAEITNIPHGEFRMDALADAIYQADQAKDPYWQMLFRYMYACEATFYDDPTKAIPVSEEFGPIFEVYPNILPDDGGVECYLMITQMGIDPIVFLPDISMEEWEEKMDQFYVLVKRYHIGLRTYWWQMCRFWQYKDKEKSFEYFQKFWKTGRDGLSDCRACERSYAVKMSLLVGDKEAADNYAKPMEQGRIRFCSDTPQLYWLAYLEYALDRGDLREARRRANALYRKGNRDKSDLSYVGAVLRCWAYTDLERAMELLQSRLDWTFRIWDQKKRYDFYKGAWVCLCQAAKRQKEILLNFSEKFECWQEDGIYDTEKLRDWFFQQAKGIGEQFDQRNGSDYFQQDLALAGIEPEPIEE